MPLLLPLNIPTTTHVTLPLLRFWSSSGSSDDTTDTVSTVLKSPAADHHGARHYYYNAAAWNKNDGRQPNRRQELLASDPLMCKSELVLSMKSRKLTNED